MAPVGYFTFVLHTHIPHVLGHGVWPHGSDWLMEAFVETYIPLLEAFRKLKEAGGRCSVTIGLTPVLVDQVQSRAFGPALREYVDQRIASAERNQAAFALQGAAEMAAQAERWKSFYAWGLDAFERTYEPDPTGALKSFADDVAAELIPSAVTHAYLPLLGSELCLKAQVAGAVHLYERRFGAAPAGFWLPECGYRPAEIGTGGRKGIDEVLAEAGVRYFITDHHLLTGAPGGGYGYSRSGLWSGNASPGIPDPMLPLEPYWIEGGAAGRTLAVFSREPGASLQVWSHEFGYPGSAEYLEFHKKHHDGGLRYWRVTDRHTGLEKKQPYDAAAALAKAKEHAAHYVTIIRSRLDAYAAAHGRPGTMIAPFDTELFGHWWFEGPAFMTEVLRLLPKNGVEVRTCAEQLSLAPPRRTARLFEGSWGEGGDHRMWLNMFTVHMWEEVNRAEAAFAQIAGRHAATNDLLLRRVLGQMARTLMLLESSDWFFLVTTATARDYAEERFTRLLYHFKMLKAIAAVALGRGELGEKEIEQLETVEAEDGILADVDLLAEYA
ncbi:MAG: DUF1957 domain-containing protein [Deltaproteobacteria bacterium]|nr:DUF1957 domain-containing protein [Deltaproteobacteria bacterium]